MYAKLNSASILGVDGMIVEVEVDISNGLPVFDLIGLPDSAVREARDRVRAAVKNSGVNFPLQRITTNLAPADIKKEGAGFDLAIAVGILIASGQLTCATLEDTLIIGELSLEGKLRPLKGTLSMVMVAKEKGIHRVILPEANKEEGALVAGMEIIPASSLTETVSYLRGEWCPLPIRAEVRQDEASFTHDFADVQGQVHVKRAMEIAAAGGHNLMLIGPPGSGKTMLARRISTILPTMLIQEALEVTKISSIAGTSSVSSGLIRERPFRSPHHTISQAGLIGGGSIPKPGEVSLAHRGVLFLDELPEFSKSTLEVLRQPLEDQEVTLGRARAVLTFPSSFMLLCSMNPCPCGYFGYEEDRSCTCTPPQIQRYRAKISGPLLDRIDLHISVPRVDYETLSAREVNESSAEIRRRVASARHIQAKRFEEQHHLTNSNMQAADMRVYCQLNVAARRLLQQAFENLGLSARAHDRILKVARTIADLAQSDMIEVGHIAEAIQYRTLDRKYWE
ncbi:YifB family Mg chelatase-like AAA ATPase [Hazenella sp. IB182357]|uniref:YifB family Mg chelatase-like AAA ATPase n=1 Tax=Polycladospora coralii TaxID=2771432 RepID=A0A926RSL5_9BACL|nr:YifB family Mg chelatase-like AAA ATPase [Polycladospora coralii]MBD1371430.1 YifB family Mg chelatase-like AAA ATPase [Polycladospora coralii]MBS7530398.1 YifB family Mg chelatase-like AAA ATPase [Polycladospora coralii]